MVKFISFNSGKFSFEFVNDEFVGLVLIIVIKDNGVAKVHSVGAKIRNWKNSATNMLAKQDS
jgi:hypothetical protein